MTSATKLFQRAKEKIAVPSRTFWRQRQRHERVMLSCAIAAFLLALLYLLLIAPALSGRIRLQKNLPALRQQAAELQMLTTRAVTLSGRTVLPVSPISKDAIEAALMRKGLKAESVIVNGDSAKVQLSNVAFAGLLDWLDDMQKTAHWQVTDATVSGQAGLVNVSLTLWQQKDE